MISKAFRYSFVAAVLAISISPFVRSNSASPQSPKLESCKPASERTGQEGCWIIASSRLGNLADKPVFWTLDVYPTKAAAEREATPGSTFVEALGKVWLFTVGDKVKPAAQATRMAEIGPVPVKAGE